MAGSQRYLKLAFIIVLTAARPSSVAKYCRVVVPRRSNRPRSRYHGWKPSLYIRNWTQQLRNSNNRTGGLYVQRYSLVSDAAQTYVVAFMQQMQKLLQRLPRTTSKSCRYKFSPVISYIRSSSIRMKVST